MDTLGALWIVWSLAALAGVVAIAGMWLWTLVEVLRREWPSPGDRTTWTLVVILLPVLGAFLYRVIVPAPTARPAGR